jgi:hypothetical protein
MPTSYELRRRQKALLEKAFPKAGRPLITKAQKLDETKKVIK